MSTHLSRLRRQCQPVQEDTPVVPREHRISVDKRDLLQLLADYDANALSLAETMDQLADYSGGDHA
jgi:hypothetical protein